MTDMITKPDNEVKFEPVPESKIPADILAVKDPNETILWVGEPENWLSYRVYGNRTSWTLVKELVLLVAIWLLIYGRNETFVYICTFVFLFRQILETIRMNNTYYAVSDRRIIASQRLIGATNLSVDYDDSSDIKVEIGWYDYLFNTGSIVYANCSFRGIKNYNDICKKIKSLAIDIKTDWKYPNIKRVSKNPGYNTKISSIK